MSDTFGWYIFGAIGGFIFGVIARNWMTEYAIRKHGNTFIGGDTRVVGHLETRRTAYSWEREK